MEQLDPEITYIQNKVALRCGRGASITSTVGHEYVTANCSLTFTPLVSLRDD